MALLDGITTVDQLDVASRGSSCGSTSTSR